MHGTAAKASGSYYCNRSCFKLHTKTIALLQKAHPSHYCKRKHPHSQLNELSNRLRFDDALQVVPHTQLCQPQQGEQGVNEQLEAVTPASTASWSDIFVDLEKEESESQMQSAAGELIVQSGMQCTLYSLPLFGHCSK